MNDSVNDKMQRPLALLETLCDFATVGNPHDIGQIDMDNLSLSLDTIIRMIKHAIAEEASE